MNSVEAARLLGCDDSRSPERLRTAWRAYARCHHPDAGGALPEFLAGQAAYDLLREHQQRLRPEPVQPASSADDPSPAAGFRFEATPDGEGCQAPPAGVAVKFGGYGQLLQVLAASMASFGTALVVITGLLPAVAAALPQWLGIAAQAGDLAASSGPLVNLWGLAPVLAAVAFAALLIWLRPTRELPRSVSRTVLLAAAGCAAVSWVAALLPLLLFVAAAVVAVAAVSFGVRLLFLAGSGRG